MKLSENAAAHILANGAFLMATDAGEVLKVGDVIDVTSLLGLRVVCVAHMAIIDAPPELVAETCRQVNDGFSPHYSDFVYETAEQAALAQMMYDAGAGFDVDDILDWQSLDTGVSVISVAQVVIDGN